MTSIQLDKRFGLDPRHSRLRGIFKPLELTRREFLGSSALGLASIAGQAIADDIVPVSDLHIVIEPYQVRFYLVRKAASISAVRDPASQLGDLELDFELMHFGKHATPKLYAKSDDRKMLRIEGVSFGLFRDRRLDFHFARVGGHWRIWLESAFLRPNLSDTIGLGKGKFSDPRTWPLFKDFYDQDGESDERPPLSLWVSTQRIRYFLDSAFGAGAIVPPPNTAILISFHRKVLWRLHAPEGEYFSTLTGAAQSRELRLCWVDPKMSPLAMVRNALGGLEEREAIEAPPPGLEEQPPTMQECGTGSLPGEPGAIRPSLWGDEQHRQSENDERAKQENTDDSVRFAALGTDDAEGARTALVELPGDPCTVRISTESAILAAEASDDESAESIVIVAALMGVTVIAGKQTRLDTLPSMPGFAWQIHGPKLPGRFGASIRVSGTGFNARTHLGLFKLARLDPIAPLPGKNPLEPRVEIRGHRGKLERFLLPGALTAADHQVVGASFSELKFDSAPFEIAVGDFSANFSPIESVLRLDRQTGTMEVPVLRLVLDQARLKVARDRNLISLNYRFRDLALVVSNTNEDRLAIYPYRSGRADAPLPEDKTAQAFADALHGKETPTEKGIVARYRRPVYEKRGRRLGEGTAQDRRATLVVDFGVMHTLEQTNLDPAIEAASWCPEDAQRDRSALLKQDLALDTFDTTATDGVIQHDPPAEKLGSSELLDFLLAVESRRETRSPRYKLIRDAFRDTRIQARLNAPGGQPAPAVQTDSRWETEFFYGVTSAFARKSRHYTIAETTLSAHIDEYFAQASVDGFNDPITETRHAGATRIAFRVDETDYGRDSTGGMLDFSIAGLTDWRRFDLSVIRRAEKFFEPGPGGRLPPKWARTEVLDEAEQLLHQGFVRDPGQSAARWMARVASLAETHPSMLQTAIEMPARLVLSPAQDATVAAPIEIESAVASALFDAGEQAIRERLVHIDEADPEKIFHDPVLREDLWAAETDFEGPLPQIRAVASPDFRPGAFLRITNDRASQDLLDGQQIPGASPPPHGPFAPWTLGTFDTDGGPPETLQVLEEKNSFWKSFFSRPRTRGEFFRMPIDAADRHQIVGLSSVHGLRTLGRRMQSGTLVAAKAVDNVSRAGSQFEPPFGFHLHDVLDDEALYRPQPLEVRELTLSALGGSIDMDTTFVPPASARYVDGKNLFNAFSIERYRHRIVLGRDISSEVVYKGFMFPYGFRAAFVKVTERRFELRHRGEAPRCYLVQRLFLRCTRPIISYPTTGQPNSGRQWPCQQMTLLTTQTPDLIDPAVESAPPTGRADRPVLVNGRGRVFVKGAAGKGLIFWPQRIRHCKNNSGGRMLFSLEFDGSDEAGPCPMIFVDNTAAHESTTLEALAAYWDRDWQSSPDNDMDPWFGDASTLRHHSSVRRYAPELTAGDTSHETETWTVGVQGKVFTPATSVPRDSTDKKSVYEGTASYSHDAVLEGLEIPPFYPVMREARIRVKRIERLQGQPVAYVPVRFDGEYVREGFPAEEPAEEPTEESTEELAENTPGGTTNDLDHNRARLYLNLIHGTPITMGAQGDRAGAIGRPEGTVVALSQSIGVINGTLGGEGNPDPGALASSTGEYNVLPSYSRSYQRRAVPRERATNMRSDDFKNLEPHLQDAQLDLEDLAKKIFGDKKLLGIVKYSEICQIALDERFAPSIKDGLSDTIRQHTDSVREDLSYGASLLAEDTLETVKSTVIVPLGEAISGFRQQLDRLDVKVSTGGGGPTESFELKDIYPDVLASLDKFERSVVMARAENDPVSFGLMLGGCYENGRSFILVIENLAKDPIGPAKKAVLGTLESGLEAIRRNFSTSQSALFTEIGKTAGHFINSRNDLAAAIRTRLLQARLTLLQLPEPVFAGDLGVAVKDALDEAWNDCVNRLLTDPLAMLSRPLDTARALVKCYAQGASSALDNLVDQPGQQLEVREVLLLEQAKTSFDQFSAEVEGLTLEQLLAPKMRTATDRLESIHNSIETFDRKPVEASVAVLKDLHALTGLFGVHSDLAENVTRIQKQACHDVLGGVRDLARSMRLPAITEPKRAAEMHSHLKAPNYRTLCKEFPALSGLDPLVLALVEPIKALCDVVSSLDQARSELPDQVRQDFKMLLDSSIGELRQVLMRAALDTAQVSSHSLSALVAYDTVRLSIDETFGEPSDTVKIPALCNQLRSGSAVGETFSEITLVARACLRGVQSAQQQILAGIAQIESVAGQILRSVNSSRYTNIGNSSLDDDSKQKLVFAVNRTDTALAAVLGPQLASALKFVRTSTTAGVGDQNSGIFQVLYSVAKRLNDTKTGPLMALSTSIRTFLEDTLFTRISTLLADAEVALASSADLEAVEAAVTNLESGLSAVINSTGEAMPGSMRSVTATLGDVIASKIDQLLREATDELLGAAANFAVDILIGIEERLGEVVAILSTHVAALYKVVRRQRDSLYERIRNDTGALGLLEIDILIVGVPEDANDPLATDVLALEAAAFESLAVKAAMGESADIARALLRGLKTLDGVSEFVHVQALVSGDKEPAPLVLIRRLRDKLLDALRGNFAGLVDLQKIRLEIERYLSELIPTKATTRFNHDLHLGNFPASDPILITNRNGKQGRLRLQGTTEIDLLPVVQGDTPKPAFEASAELSAFSVRLIGRKFHGITFHFSQALFAASSDRAAQMDVILDSFELGPLLSFIDQLKSFFPNGGNGFYVEPTVAPFGVRAGYGLNIGMISLGACSFTNISINAEARLPFDGGEALFAASLATKKNPCILSWAPYGGTMFFSLLGTAKGLVGLEAGFEGGAVAAFGIGPLEGIGRITFGVYVGVVEGRTTIGAMFFVGGSARIWVFGVAASLYLSAGQDASGAMSGEAIFTYSFSIGFADFEFEVVFWKNEKKNFGGSAGAEPVSTQTGGRDDSASTVGARTGQAHRLAAAAIGDDTTPIALSESFATNHPTYRQTRTRTTHQLESKAICQGVSWRHYKSYFVANATALAADEGGSL